MDRETIVAGGLIIGTLTLVLASSIQDPPAEEMTAIVAAADENSKLAEPLATIPGTEMSGPVYSPELTDVLKDLGLPKDNRTQVEGCSTLAALNKSVTSWEICNDASISPCAFSADKTCKSNLQIVNGQIHSISYVYDEFQFAPPDTKAILDKKFGTAQWDSPPKLEHPDGSWMLSQTAKWRSGKIEILLMLMAGRRSDDERYMNASLIVSDKEVPEPVPAEPDKP